MAMTMSVPQDKLRELLEELDSWSKHKRRVTLKEVEIGWQA